MAVDRMLEVAATVMAAAIACVACVQSCSSQQRNEALTLRLAERERLFQQRQFLIGQFSANRERASLSSPASTAAYVMCLNSAINLKAKFGNEDYLEMMPRYDDAYLAAVFFDNAPMLERIRNNVRPPVSQVMKTGDYTVSAGLFRRVKDASLREEVFTIRRRLDQHDATRGVDVLIRRDRSGRNVIILGGFVSEGRAKSLLSDIRELGVTPDAAVVDAAAAGL